MKRKDFLTLSAIAAGAGTLAGVNACASPQQEQNVNSILDNLQTMTEGVQPITVSERQERIKKAQRLLKDAGMAALVLDSGTTMNYFTGLRWGRSERTMVVVIPAQGEVSYVCPGFEEGRMRELIKIGKQVYVWQEDENPSLQIIKAINEAGGTSGKVGIEESTRFFIVDGLRKVAPQFEYVSGDPVTIPCRLIKSATELALMQKATEITIAAMKLGISSLREGMAPSEFSQIVATAHQKLGAVNDFAMANFGEASAFPHGSTQPQQLKKGDVVLMDCGCLVQGYASDISRTVVFGAEPTARQLEIWNLEKKAQLAGFAAAQLGKPCESVDAAARRVLTDAGFGPGYNLPGLPHRTGHGIGMEGHEWGYIVKGNQLPLQPGMCFSIEPNISIVGEFGIRHEDCVYMTDEGPRWFSQPSVSISQPFA